MAHSKEMDFNNVSGVTKLTFIKNHFRRILYAATLTAGMKNTNFISTDLKLPTQAPLTPQKVCLMTNSPSPEV